jgi:hypothetical protein
MFLFLLVFTLLAFKKKGYISIMNFKLSNGCLGGRTPQRLEMGKKGKISGRNKNLNDEVL